MIEIKITIDNGNGAMTIAKDGKETDFDKLDSLDRYRVIQKLSDIDEEMMRIHKTLW